MTQAPPEYRIQLDNLVRDRTAALPDTVGEDMRALYGLAVAAHTNHQILRGLGVNPGFNSVGLGALNDAYQRMTESGAMTENDALQRYQGDEAVCGRLAEGVVPVQMAGIVARAVMTPPNTAIPNMPSSQYQIQLGSLIDMRTAALPDTVGPELREQYGRALAEHTNHQILRGLGVNPGFNSVGLGALNDTYQRMTGSGAMAENDALLRYQWDEAACRRLAETVVTARTREVAGQAVAQAAGTTITVPNLRGAIAAGPESNAR